jgi:hypothetical protein
MRSASDDKHLLRIFRQQLAADREAGAIAGVVSWADNGAHFADVAITTASCDPLQLIVAASALLDEAVALLREIEPPPLRLLTKTEAARDLLNGALARRPG